MTGVRTSSDVMLLRMFPAVEMTSTNDICPELSVQARVERMEQARLASFHLSNSVIPSNLSEAHTFRAKPIIYLYYITHCKLRMEKATFLKERGNALFKAQKYGKSRKVYADALRLLDENSSGGEGGIEDDKRETQYLQAVLFSNQSSSSFELGDYIASMDSSRSCLTILDDGINSKNAGEENLKRKNLLRLARASFYAGSVSAVGTEEDNARYATTVVEPLTYLSQCGDALYEKRSKAMLVQVESRRKIALAASAGNNGQNPAPAALPSIHRASLYGSSVREYYTYGHDKMKSALARGEPVDKGSNTPSCAAIDLSKLSDSDLSSISVLFGGVGDARHVFATICDAHKQWKSLPDTKQKRFRLHLTLNDILPTVLARDLLVFASLIKLADCAPTFASISTSDQARGLAALLQYTFFGYVMPPSVYDSQMKLIRELLESDFKDLKTRFVAEESVWSEIKKIFVYWRDSKEGCGYFPTTNKILEDVYRLVPEGFGPTELISNLYIDAAPPARRTDAVFLTRTRTILPPKGLDDQYDRIRRAAMPSYNSIGRDIGGGQKKRNKKKNRKGERKKKKADVALFQDLMEHEAKSEISEHWKVNRTLFDPVWLDFFGGHIEKHEFNPVADIETFMRDDVLQYYEQSLGWANTAVNDLDFSGCSNLLFWNVAYALTNLISADVLCLELSVGPITSFCRDTLDNTDARTAIGYPTKYHRILLSNIPDYIGMLSVFAEVLPLLHRPSRFVPTYIEANVLLNTSIWKDYAQYIHSTTGISTLDGVEELFGIRCMGPNDIWAQHQWTWSERSLATKDKLYSWLDRLLMRTVLPPDRVLFAPCMEQCTMNVATFMRVCVLCVDVLGYPSHWMGQYLEGLYSACSKGVIETAALIPSESPPLYRGEWTRKNRIDISAFQMDIRAQLELWAHRFEKTLLPLIDFHPRDRFNTYELVLDGMDQNGIGGLLIKGGIGKSSGVWGKNSSMSLGFALVQKVPRDALESAMAQFREKRVVLMPAPNGDSVSIRNDIIKQGNKFGQVFSCMDFNCNLSNQEAHSISFQMRESIYARFEDFFIIPIRTDSWYWVGYGAPNRLREAKKME